VYTYWYLSRVRTRALWVRSAFARTVRFYNLQSILIELVNVGALRITHTWLVTRCINGDALSVRGKCQNVRISISERESCGLRVSAARIDFQTYRSRVSPPSRVVKRCLFSFKAIFPFLPVLSAFFSALFLIIRHRKPTASWGLTCVKTGSSFVTLRYRIMVVGKVTRTYTRTYEKQ